VFFWIYDLPTWALGVLLSAVFVAVTWAGTLVFRTFVHARLRSERRANDLIGVMLSSFSVIYGVLLGLIAIAAFQSYSTTEDTVSHEAASLSSLYHMASNYPQPERQALQQELTGYALVTIKIDWPLQKHGIAPAAGSRRMVGLYATLLSFQPKDPAQVILHAAMLGELNRYVELRRQRLHETGSGIPTVLWCVVFIGALLNIMLIWLLDMELHVHLILGGVLSLFIGLVIFIIAALDHPFRGTVSISADALRSIYDSQMKP
jgi:hypothetical protein